MSLEGRSCLVPLLLLFLPGCVHRSPATEPPASRPVPDARALLAQMAARPRATSFRATFKVKLETGERTSRLNGNLLVREDAGLRAELLSIVGPPVAYATLTQKNAFLYLPLQGNTFFSATEPEALMGRLTGGTMALSDLVAILLGGAPPCEKPGKVRYRSSDDRFLLRCEEEDVGGYLLAVAPEGGEVTEVEGLSSRGTVRFKGRFGEFDVVDGVTFARQVVLDLPKRGQLELHFQEIEVNPELPAELFELSPPPGSRREALEALFPPAGD